MFIKRQILYSTTKLQRCKLCSFFLRKIGENYACEHELCQKLWYHNLAKPSRVYLTDRCDDDDDDDDDNDDDDDDNDDHDDDDNDGWVNE